MEQKLEFEGLQELIDELNAVANEAQIKEVDASILKRSAPIIQKEMQKRIPISADNSKSGRHKKGGGSGTKGHAKDNVPITNVKSGKNAQYITIGWELKDDSDYFYLKFVKWGTLSMPPRDFITPVRNSADTEIERIAEEEYQRFLDRAVK